MRNDVNAADIFDVPLQSLADKLLWTDAKLQSYIDNGWLPIRVIDGRKFTDRYTLNYHLHRRDQQLTRR